jgi:hypothetical protein
VRYTDIVKARALKRAGRACEMCGMRLNFDSGQFVSAHPIFGVLFDQDDCCVLCTTCLGELDPETRAAAEQGPANGTATHEACEDPPEPIPITPEARSEGREAEADEHRDEPSAPTGFPRPPRHPRGGGRFPSPDPDGGMCA